MLGGGYKCNAKVTDNLSEAVYRNHTNSIFDYLTDLFTRLTSTNQKIENLESGIISATQSMKNGKQLLANKLGVDTSGGLPTFSLLDQKIDETRSGYYNSGYNSGYNVGVSAADNRSNPNSNNYKSGYEAGKQAGFDDVVFGKIYDKVDELMLCAGQEYPVELHIAFIEDTYVTKPYFTTYYFALAGKGAYASCSYGDTEYLIDTELNRLGSHCCGYNGFTVDCCGFVPNITIYGKLIDKTSNTVIADYSGGKIVKSYVYTRSASSDGLTRYPDECSNFHLERACRVRYDGVYNVNDYGEPISDYYVDNDGKLYNHQYVFLCTSTIHYYVVRTK